MKSYQEADKAAAFPTKAKKISPRKSREMLFKAESRQQAQQAMNTTTDLQEREPESEKLVARRGFPFRQLPAAPQRKQNQLSCTHQNSVKSQC